MNKLKKFSNQELLTEIEQRVPDFTPVDLVKLFQVIGHNRQQIEKFYQTISPEFSQWYQEKAKEVKELKNKNNWKIKKSWQTLG